MIYILPGVPCAVPPATADISFCHCNYSFVCCKSAMHPSMRFSPCQLEFSFLVNMDSFIVRIEFIPIRNLTIIK